MKKSHRLCAEAIRQIKDSATKLDLCRRFALKFEANYFDFDKEEFKNRCGFEDYSWRTNLISGLEYLEETNTPNCCSPSTETYWSM